MYPDIDTVILIQSSKVEISEWNSLKISKSSIFGIIEMKCSFYGFTHGDDIVNSILRSTVLYKV